MKNESKPPLGQPTIQTNQKVVLEFGEILYLYFKVGKSPSSWTGHYITSRDLGKTWSHPYSLARGIIGPTKNTPTVVDDLIISGSSDEKYGFSMHFEISRDGKNWSVASPGPLSDLEGSIQPAIIHLGNGHLKAFARSSTGYIVRTESTDGGNTWGPLKKTDLPNPDSGISSISVREDLHVLAYNKSKTGRSPLVIAVSTDGEAWSDRLTLESEPGEFSYPSLCLCPNGIIVSYTVNRNRIACVEVPVERL